MKKLVNIIAIFLVLFLLIFSVNLYAASLTNINITTDKQTVHPGEEIKINIDFGEDLGAYTFDIAYDSNLLEYVSSEGGTANDNGTRIRVYFYDQTGGSSPRNSMSVIFRAKEGIVTSNPTDLSVTAEGLASPDASISYDDITIPITKNIMVEPNYTDYNIALNYTGDIIKDEEKEMKIIISSSMGKNYEHTRIIAETSNPTGETVKLLATDSQNLEHDIIQSGWGDIQGDPIGGKDVVKELNVKGLFSGAGNYAITLKLIDRDQSDIEIASKTFQIEVKEKAGVETPPEGEVQNPSEELKPENVVENQIKNEEAVNQPNKPTTLPKTGTTIYFTLFIILAFVCIGYLAYKKKN